MSTTDSTPDANENASEQGQDVSTIELFFDLVFVFAFTQVTGFLAHHLTWAGVAKGAALLAAVWWAWVMYSWLTGAVSPQENLLQRVVIFAAMAAMLVVALSVPGAFETTALLFAVAYFVVRLLHIALYTAATPPETRDAVLRAAPGFLGGPALLVLASFFDGPLKAILWVVAIAIDYGIVFVRGVEGFRVNVEHFVERYRLIVIIALGESIVAIGSGVGAGGIALGPLVILSYPLGIRPHRRAVVALFRLRRVRCRTAPRRRKRPRPHTACTRFIQCAPSLDNRRYHLRCPRSETDSRTRRRTARNYRCGRAVRR